MPTSFKFYHDAALTSEITSGVPLSAAHDTSGGSPAVDDLIYFGSTSTGLKAQVSSNPGVTAIQISISDSASGSGAPATQFKLATTQGGLTAAVAGNPLSLSTQVLSGVANAVPIWTRRSSAITVAGAYTDLSLVTQTLVETPV